MTSWTPEQQAFITAVGTTPDSLRLDAVAGSGKTTTLLEAAKGLDPGLSIIALAFNKNIADTLQKKFPAYVECKTLNSIGSRIWYNAQGRKNLDAKKMSDLTTRYTQRFFTQLERSVLWTEVNTIARSLKQNGFVPQEWKEHLNSGARAVTPEVVEAICDAEDFKFTEKTYTAALEVLRASITEAMADRIDFDDQIYMSTYFAPQEAFPVYDVVMVDEAQDLSMMQHDLIERLGARSRLIVVGDERQAIYGWRGASCNSLTELQERFGLRSLPLTVCFRCPSAIIKEAQEVVPHITASREGGVVTLWPNNLISHMTGKAWYVEDIPAGSVVLCRNNAPLLRLAFGMIKAGMRIYLSGKDMGETLKKIIKSFPEDEAPASSIETWFENEEKRLRENGKNEKIGLLMDKYEGLLAICAGVSAKTKSQLVDGIDRLFAMEPRPEAVELSTIHKSKGKEWHHVYFLNEHLLPNQWVQNAADNGQLGAADLLKQEDNLRYVAVTRALETLTYITLDKEEVVLSRKDSDLKQSA